MKTLVTVLVVTAAFAVFGKQVKAPAGVGEKQPMTEEEKAMKRAAMQKRMLEKTGGIIDKVGTGRIVVVNCQKKISPEVVRERAAFINKSIRVNMDVIEGTWKFGDGRAKGANASLYVIDDDRYPMSLVAAEEQWGVLNVARIDEGPRFNKAFARAATLAFGAGVSQIKNSPMQTVTKPDDLDKIIAQGLTMDAYISVTRNLQALGVTQTRKTSYRKACEEGWAPAPTNDYQKVIWEEVHAKPTNPMKIKYDPKKGE